MQVKHVPIDSVTSFSKRDKSYLLNPEKFDKFLSFPFEYTAFNKVISNRLNYNVDRELLVNVLNTQYQDLNASSATSKHIENLKNKNCFTITTAHQPSLMTGPLYYIYKILSTIKLCRRLTKDFPQNQFVPMFVIGGEDHDFEEINHLYLFNKKIEWDAESGGPVGRLSIEELDRIINQVSEILGPNNNAAALLSSIKNLTDHCKTYGEFAFKLTHLIFDHLGVVIFQMDNALLKKNFIPIIKEEIFNNVSQSLILETQSEIENLGFKDQAFARKINFFYIDKNGRNRIERSENGFSIVDTDLVFSEDAMNIEIDNHPERFSPNVVMRPLYQELILPNLAYIGGGGELAYWMERKTQFEHFKLPFPMLIRRTSAMIISDQQIKQLNKLGFEINDSFKEELDLIQTYIHNSDNPDFSLENAQTELEKLFNNIEEHSKLIDPALSKTVKSELSKSKKSIDYLESKFKKSIKQKEEVQINRIKKIKQKLFPSGLQERHDNIFEYLSKYGETLIEEMLDHCDPFDKTFKVFIPSQK